MIVLEKSHRNLLDYIQFLSEKWFKFIKKIYFDLIKNGIVSGEKMRNSGNYNYNYAHSFFGMDF